MTDGPRESWLEVKGLIGKSRSSKKVLQALTDAGLLYERYVELARLNVLPLPFEDELEAPTEPAPTTDRPLGLVVDPAAFHTEPLGFHFVNQD